MLRQTEVAIVHEASYCHHRHNDGYVPTQPMDYTNQYPNQNQSQTSANPNQNSTKVRVRTLITMRHNCLNFVWSNLRSLKRCFLKGW